MLLQPFLFLRFSYVPCAEARTRLASCNAHTDQNYPRQAPKQWGVRFGGNWMKHEGAYLIVGFFAAWTLLIYCIVAVTILGGG
jgi:hypothetical protein